MIQGVGRHECTRNIGKYPKKGLNGPKDGGIGEEFIASFNKSTLKKLTRDLAGVAQTIPKMAHILLVNKWILVFKVLSIFRQSFPLSLET
jgi:hypothetical protein